MTPEMKSEILQLLRESLKCDAFKNTNSMRPLTTDVQALEFVESQFNHVNDCTSVAISYLRERGFFATPSMLSERACARIRRYLELSGTDCPQLPRSHWQEPAVTVTLSY